MPNLKNHTPENRSFALMREILCLKQKNEAKVFKRIVIQFRPINAIGFLQRETRNYWSKYFTNCLHRQIQLLLTSMKFLSCPCEKDLSGKMLKLKLV